MSEEIYNILIITDCRITNAALLHLPSLCSLIKTPACLSALYPFLPLSVLPVKRTAQPAGEA